MPLPDWVLTKAKDWGCVPQASIYFLKSSDIRGWSIETSGDFELFWIAPEDRSEETPQILKS